MNLSYLCSTNTPCHTHVRVNRQRNDEKTLGRGIEVAAAAVKHRRQEEQKVLSAGGGSGGDDGWQHSDILSHLTPVYVVRA